MVDDPQKIDRIIEISQSPIGRTPRSNPATYTGVFDDIRDLFTKTVDAKSRGYQKGRFSFNVKGGRCEACSGDGVKKYRCIFYRMFMSSVKFVKAHGIIRKHYKLSIAIKTLLMF